MKRLCTVILLILFLMTGCGGSPNVAVAPPHVPTTNIVPQLIEENLDTEESPPPEEIPDGWTQNAYETLNSLELVDSYPLYTMHYVGDYGQIASLRNENLTPGIIQNSWACTLFTSLGDEENMLYGRNFDWDYSPALLLFTDPPGGYASVSIVDLAYFGLSDDDMTQLDQLPLTERTALLDTPWWPFDGMNEVGLVIGMAAVPSGRMVDDPQKATLGSLEVMRMILDNALDVDEALEIISSHNIDMEGGPSLHYLIADRSGRAILVEFYQGEQIVIPNEQPWHAATNFLCSSVNGQEEGRCWRYDTVVNTLNLSGGALSIGEGNSLLNEVSQPNTQWSVLYGISTGNMNIVMGREYDDVISAHLELKEE